MRGDVENEELWVRVVGKKSVGRDGARVDRPGKEIPFVRWREAAKDPLLESGRRRCAYREPAAWSRAAGRKKRENEKNGKTKKTEKKTE